MPQQFKQKSKQMFIFCFISPLIFLVLWGFGPTLKTALLPEQSTLQLPSSTTIKRNSVYSPCTHYPPFLPIIYPHYQYPNLFDISFSFFYSQNFRKFLQGLPNIFFVKHFSGRILDKNFEKY